MKSTLSEQIRAALKGSEAMHKFASSEVTGAAEGVQMEKADSPAAAQDGVISDVIAGSIKGPGADSNVVDGVPEISKNTIGEASGAAENIDVDAAAVLKIKEEPVTKENLDMIDKAASAMQKLANSIAAASDCRIQQAFEKVASAEARKTENAPIALLHKMASDGDSAAQYMCDFIASYNAGVVKKANDLSEAVGENATPEDVTAAEEALNAQALSELGGAEMQQQDVEQLVQQVSAEIEAAAQGAVVETAEQLLETDPSLSEEKALKAAQAAVVDALEVLEAQQLIGQVDAEGAPVVPDEVAEAAVGEMLKSASAFPLRDHLCGKIGTSLGLDPSAFAARISR